MDFRIYDLGFLQNYWRVTIPLSIFACLVADFPRCIENRNNCTVISIRNIYYSIYIMNLLHSILWYYRYVKKKKKLYHITNIENIKKLLKNSGLERNENKTRNQKKKKKKFEISLCIASQTFVYKLYSFLRHIYSNRPLISFRDIEDWQRCKSCFHDGTGLSTSSTCSIHPRSAK